MKVYGNQRKSNKTTKQRNKIKHRSKNRNKNKKKPLTALKLNQQAQVFKTPDHSLLPSFGLRKGKKIKINCKQWCGGPLIVEIEGREVALNRKLAEDILVYLKE